MPKRECSELSKVITDLAMQIGERPGMDSLDKVTAELQSHIPEITREVVASSIVEASTTHRQVLSEIATRLKDLKLEARTDQALRKQIGELEAHLAEGTRPRGGPRRDRSTETVRQLRKVRDRLRGEVGPSEHAKKSAEARSIEALEAKILGLEQNLAEGTLPEQAKRTEAASERIQDLRKQRDALKKRVRQSVPAQRRKLADEIRRLSDKLEAVDNVPPTPRTETPAAKELEDLVYQRNRLRRKVRERIASMRPRTFWSKVGEPVNLARSIMTSLDLSAVFRQGGFIALGHPQRGLASVKPMIAALRSEQASRKIDDEIHARPNAPLYDRSKLFLAPLDGVQNKQEEAFMSRLAGKIPLVAGSQRAYVTFLNNLRADSFDAMVETLGRGGEVTLEEARAIANYVNVATGRGPLGRVGEQAGQALATVFFAPRLVASRFQLLTGQPVFGGSARTRKLIAQDYGRFLAGVGAVYMLAALAGGEPEDDPRSSDFGKIRFGRTRVDPLTGLSQVTVLVSRLASGETKSSNSGKVTLIRGQDVPFGRSTASDVVFRFLRSKLSPLFGSALNVTEGKNVVGEEVTAGGEAARMVIPLAYRDVQEVMQEHGVAKGTALAILSVFGMSVQTYGKVVDVTSQADVGKLLYKLTAPSAETTPEEWALLKGVSEADAVAALRARAKSLGSRTRPRTSTGKLTTFGERRARLLRAMRAR